MSVNPKQWVLSTGDVRVWVIAVIILIVVAWRPAAEIVGAGADVAGVMVALGVSCGTASKYSNRNGRPRPAESV
ncbi:hypothetical protein [Streptomyces sp. NPDC088139]|uniref:hypothetical protein n=1 Tax=Streptomyces sp. NPDC088139 TaxID=3365828 RepID=UPI0037FDC45B